MLQVQQSRYLDAQLRVNRPEGGFEVVKSYNITINDEGVSSVSESMHNQELYRLNRAEMRKDEARLREMRYALEDQIIAEKEEKDSEEGK